MMVFVSGGGETGGGEGKGPKPFIMPWGDASCLHEVLNPCAHLLILPGIPKCKYHDNDEMRCAAAKFFYVACLNNMLQWCLHDTMLLTPERGETSGVEGRETSAYHNAHHKSKMP